MKPRKMDYLIFYLITAILLIINLMSPLKLADVIGALLLTIVPALILGTITNFIFQRKNNSK